VATLSTPTTPSGRRVTKRETEILALLPLRLSNAEIAARLVISQRTVESHVSALLRKFGAANRDQLAQIALDGAATSSPGLSAAAERRPPRFIGRGAELELLDNELSAARTRGFRVVGILGEAGLGKSRLVAEFAGRADARCLFARAFPLGATSPLAVWIDAVEPALLRLRPHQIRRLCGTLLEDVVAAMPRLAEVFGTPAPERRSHRRMVDALALILQRMAAERPVVVVLDDAHLADSTSWKALDRLRLELAGDPILVLLTARARELSAHPTAQQLLIRLAETGALTRMALAPLEAGDLAALSSAVLGRIPAESLSDWLVTKSRGSPLFAIGLLEALVAEGADLDRPQLAALPADLSDRVRSQLTDLQPQALGLLEMLAVLGRPASINELIAVARASLAELVPLLEALIASGLVLERGSLRDLSHEIAHPMVAEVVYRGMGGARCRLLHRTIGTHLREAGRLAEAGSHFACSAEQGDPEAVDVLTQALREAGHADAYPEALAILGLLADVLPRHDQRWLDVLDALSDEAQWVLDHRADLDVAACIEAMQAMDVVLENSSDLVRRGIVKLRLSGLYSYGLGDVEQADKAARDALAAFQAAGDRPRAQLAEVELAAQHYVRGDPAGLRSAAERLLADAERSGDALLVMHVTGWAAMGSYFTGDFDQANAYFLRSAQIAASRDEHFHRAWSQAAHATACALAGAPDQGLLLLDEIAAGNPNTRESIYHECATIVHWMAGHFAEAIEHTECSLRRDGGRLGKRRGFALAFGAISAAEGARPEIAHRYLAMAEEIYQGGDFWVHGAFLLWAKAAVAHLDGRNDVALPLINQAAEKMLQVGCRTYASPILVDMVDIACAAGEPDTGLRAIQHLDSVANSLDVHFHRALARLAGAAMGTAADSVQAASRAAEVCLATGSLPYAGRAQERLGEAHLRAGQRQAARAAFRRAVELFDTCGCVTRRRRVVQRLSA
jgi:DNA-binding CsgD family transcriptional regulator/tetratricopeptide (TPR) repeat protein